MASLGVLFGILVLAPGSRAATLPAGFQETVVFSGLTQPSVIQFASDGRVFVAEKSGLIKVFDDLSDTTPTTFADLRTNVHNFWDRGLLGMALDPNFPTNPYVYVLYAWDYHPPTLYSWTTATQWGDTCPTPPGATADGCLIGGRLSRLQASGNVMTGSEQVLIEDWCQQFPSHSTGSLAFGADGALYVSGGDGASFNNVDYGQYGNQSAGDQLNPCGDPPGGLGGAMTAPTAEGGALRSQSVRRPAGEPVSLDGTILRVDPSTGLALPGNPYYDTAGASANAKRIVAYGLRNPFRTIVRPGTNEVWAADVGWNTWEELNRVADPSGTAENFGWPCYEGGGAWGGGRQSGYDGANLNLCESLYNVGDTNVVIPYYAYNHSAKVASESCPTGSSSTAGLAFYPTTGATLPYPASYRGALFFSDYSRDCIWVMFQGTNGQPDPSTRTTFVQGASNPVDLRVGPDGKLYYADFDGGRIIRVEYTGANQPPVAAASANPTSGTAPLAVSFSSAGSGDPEGGPVSYAWDLDGDGQYTDSTAANPSRTYAVGTYTVRLRVTDNQGATSTSSPITVSASNSPPVPTISAPLASTTWKVGDVITFSGGATDQQEGTLPASKLSWTLAMEHCPSNCHEHVIQTMPGVSGGSFSAPDHEYPSYLQLRLTATDSNGASATVSVDLQPKTVSLAFESSPSGLQLTVGSTSQTTPFTRTVIEGSTNSVSANSPQTVSGTSYVFSSWSDGGAQTHTITAGQSGTYTATYAASSADLRLTKTVQTSGTTATWTLGVSNLGPSPAVDVVVTDTLPSRLAYVSAPGCTYTSATRVVTCKIASLASGASQSFTLTTTVTGKGGGWITNTAQATSATADPNTANNSSTARFRR